MIVDISYCIKKNKLNYVFDLKCEKIIIIIMIFFVTNYNSVNSIKCMINDFPFNI